MAEETVRETTEAEETVISEDGASNAPANDRPNAYSFAGLLFGSWAALMIVLTLIAVVAMTIVGAVAG